MSSARTLVTADWVVPIASEPIRDAGVLIDGARVVAVGPASGLRQSAPDAEERAHLGAAIMPGLVNAHTHLSLTVLEGTSPPSPFHDWLGEVVPRILTLIGEGLEESARMGVARMLKSGITAVGDITYRDETVAPAVEAGLAGVFFHEIIAIGADEVIPHLESTGFPLPGIEEPTPAPDCGPPARVRIALSPHGPYSLGPGAIRETVRIARSADMPFMVHVAESPAEQECMLLGEGPLARLAAKQAPDFEAPRKSTVRYLDDLGALDGVIAVHVVQVDEADAALLAEKARGVVLCPRSNLYLECGEPPVRMLVDAGVRIALGTDSIASNRDFDLFAEARALMTIDPSLSPTRVLRMLTAEGAGVLGLEGHGTLVEGGPADLIVLPIGDTEDPEDTIVHTARAKQIHAVMSAGIWR